MADKPTINLTLAKLKEETKSAAEPFKLGLSGGKVVTFPDFYNSNDAEWSETVINELNNRNRVAVWPALGKWLSESDVEKLKAEKLTLMQLMKIIAAASEHYEKFYGTPGESDASAS